MFQSRSIQPIAFCLLAAAATLPDLTISAQEARQAAVTQRTAPGATNRIMTLDPASEAEAPVGNILELAAPHRETRENFRQFDGVSKGQIGDTKTLTLRFAAGAQLLTIKSTPEFKVEQGGSCVEGFTFAPNSTCTLLVRSTPQGPGHRVGKLEIRNSVDATPLFVGLGGSGYAPTISFTPSIITTVPGTYVNNKGLFSGATNLAIDGGDSLYIADTGHNQVDVIDSSGSIANATSVFGASSPISVAVDHSGDIYFNQRTDPFLTVLPSPYSESSYSSGSNNCAIGATCNLSGAIVFLSSLGSLASDNNGGIFLDVFGGEAYSLVNNSGPSSLQYIPLQTAVSYNNILSTSNFPAPFAVDSNDTLYTYYNRDANSVKECVINGETYYNASLNNSKTFPVAGTNYACGFTGDGGQARGAEISTRVGQMTFDLVGNLYFTDTQNQKVRRVDNATGVITTIAGNGAIGYTGDGGPATMATLSTPTGVTVDSQGQVYILSSSATTGTAQVVRKVGVVGALNLGNATVGIATSAQQVTLANTGNSQLDFTHVGFSSGNTSDFAIDPNTTSCNFNTSLSAGRSCKIGFIFTPSAAGGRSAVLSITSDTIVGVNTIQVSGTGYPAATLSPASFTFANTNVGATSAAQVATLTNPGKAALAISVIYFSGTGATSYSNTTTCGTTLAAGASCTISVKFTPAAAGSLPAVLNVVDNAINGRQTIALTGTGVGVAKAVVSPTSLSFPSTKVGATSATQTVTLSNPGSATLGITSIAMTGTNAKDYPLTKTCGTSLAAGGSCKISVSFKPSATGTRAATISIVTSAGTITVGATAPAVAAARKPIVTLTSPATSMLRGSSTLDVRVAGGTTRTPMGDVRLMEGGTTMMTGVLSNGTLTFDLTRLSPGLHKLRAVYVGDEWDSSAASPTLAKWVPPSFEPGKVR